MAEFLHILAETYDYSQLAEEVLRELSNKEFNSNDTRGPKSVSSFIVKLSELSPRIVIKQVTMLAKQLDSEVCITSPLPDIEVDQLCSLFALIPDHTLTFPSRIRYDAL